MANENNNLQQNQPVNTVVESKTVEAQDSNVMPEKVKTVEKVETVKKAPTSRKHGKDFIAPSQEVGEDVKESFAIKRHKDEALKQEQKNIAQKEQDNVKASKLDAEMQKLQANIDYAKQNNLSSSALEAKLQELKAEKDALVPEQAPEASDDAIADQYVEPVTGQTQPEDSREPATVGDVAQAMSPENMQVSKDQVMQQAQAINQQKIANQAQQLALQSEIDDQREMAEKAMNQLRKEDTQLNAIDPDRFWKSRSTWQKIGLGIAMMLGGGRNGNKAVDVVQNFINQDIEAQKLDNKQKLAKREEAFRRVTMELNKLEGLTKDQGKLENIKLAKQKMVNAQIKANEERKKLIQQGMLKDLILKKGIKLENLTPSQINSIFTKEDFKRAQDLRGEFNKQTTKLGTREVVNAFGDITALANFVASGPTDIFLLTKAMKFIDPNSVVREGEFHIAETASPPIKTLVRLANKFARGTRITAGDRKNFAKNALLLMKVKLKTQKKIADRYKSLARQSGVPSSLVVEDFNLADASKKEAIWEARKRKNPKADRAAFDRGWDKIAEKYNIQD